MPPGPRSWCRGCKSDQRREGQGRDCVRSLRARRQAVDEGPRPARAKAAGGGRGRVAPPRGSDSHDVHELPDRRRVPRSRVLGRQGRGEPAALAVRGSPRGEGGARASEGRGGTPAAGRRVARDRAEPETQGRMTSLASETAVAVETHRVRRLALDRSIAACLALAALLHVGFGARGLLIACVVAIFVELAAVDLERHILPNRIVLPTLLVVLGAQLVLDPSFYVKALISAAAAGLFL